MSLLEDLKPLAKIGKSSYPFLSLYLNTRWDNEKQRERVRIFVKTRLREFLSSDQESNPAGRQSLAEDAEKVEHYVKGLVNREWDEDFGGVALFACSGLGVYRLVKSYSPFDQAFHCSNRPALRAAVCHAHKRQPAILCMAKGDWGRLLEYEMGGFRREFSFRDEEFPGRHDQGGWSQARFQRHVEEHLNRNFRRLGEHLVKWKDERDVRSVILSGTESDLALFEPMLPARVRQVVSARLHLDPNATLDFILSETEKAVGDARDRADCEAADAVLDKGLGSGKAVAGPESVARAVSGGKVHVLYLDGRFQERGWRCFDCGTMGVKVPLGCPTCGAPVETVELGEELVRTTVAADGRVVALADHAGLRGEGGVAALLRYA